MDHRSKVEHSPSFLRSDVPNVRGLSCRLRARQLVDWSYDFVHPRSS